MSTVRKALTVATVYKRGASRPKRGAASGAQQGRLVIQDDLHRHGFEQSLHPAFRRKRLHERRAFQFLDDLGCNAPADEDASSGFELESQVSGFRAVKRNEEIERLFGKLRAAFERGF